MHFLLLPLLLAQVLPLTSIYLFCHFPFFFPGGVEPGEDDVSEAGRGVVPFPRRGLRLRHAQVLLLQQILLFFKLKSYHNCQTM